MGDVGSLNLQISKIVDTIVKRHHSNKPGRHVLLGDNFYPDGVHSKNDPQWNRFFNVFKSMFNHTIPIYAILGNHDYVGNPYSQVNSQFWIMPHMYYSRRVSKELCLIFIDTQLLDYGIRGESEMYSNFAEKIAMIHGQDPDVVRNQQLMWLKCVLNIHKDAKYKVVFGHYPIVSCGAYTDNLLLADLLLPIFQKYKVTAYISGHDHNMQHISRNITDSYTLNQFIVGCSSSDRSYDEASISPYCKYFGVHPGYAQISSSNKKFSVTFRDSNGSSLYQFKF